MNPSEYDLMAAVEPAHWWYVGLRDAFAQVLHRVAANQQLTNGRMLDAGCGTGQNLRWLQDTWTPTRLEGFDVSDRAVEISRSVVPEATIYQDDLCQLQHPRSQVSDDNKLDLILCSDVLYTTGTQPAMAGLRTLCSRLTSGGILLLHLPAFNWLYSQHDVAVHTRHRFKKPEVATVLKELELNIELITYRMFLLFPLVVLSRLPSILFANRTPSCDVKSDLELPNQMVNTSLRTIVQLENVALGKGIRFPWGSSLIAVGRKP